MFELYKPTFPIRGKVKKNGYVLFFLCSIIFLISYKLTSWYYFSGPGIIMSDSITHYGGIITGELTEFIQTGEETCGHAALAFFLTKIGISETETTLIRRLGTTSMLSLADLENVFLSYGFKTQLLKVELKYFKSHPETAVLHFSNKHFVVFLFEENGEPTIFDPAYGKVYVSWKILFKQFSGYMLYVYNG